MVDESPSDPNIVNEGGKGGWNEPFVVIESRRSLFGAGKNGVVEDRGGVRNKN
jgi:hypothetical protein